MDFEELLRLDRSKLIDVLTTISSETAKSLLNQIVTGVLRGDSVAKALGDGVVVDMLADSCSLDPTERAAKWKRELVLQHQSALEHLESVEALHMELRRRDGRMQMIKRGSEMFYQSSSIVAAETGADSILSHDPRWIASRTPQYWSEISLDELPVLKKAAVVQKLLDVQAEYGQTGVPDHIRKECDCQLAPSKSDFEPPPRPDIKNFFSLFLRKRSRNDRRGDRNNKFSKTRFWLRKRRAHTPRSATQRHAKAASDARGGRTARSANAARSTARRSADAANAARAANAANAARTAANAARTAAATSARRR